MIPDGICLTKVDTRRLVGKTGPWPVASTGMALMLAGYLWTLGLDELNDVLGVGVASVIMGTATPCARWRVERDAAHTLSESHREPGGERVLGFTWHQTWAIVVGLAALIVVAAVLVGSAKRRRPLLTRFNTDFFFWLGVTYLVLLLMMAIMYMGNFYGVKDRIPVILGGILPIGVPWFGAIGAVVISLEGLFQHNRRGDWDSTYSYWHMARPLFGAVLGIVAFFIFLLLIDAAGQTPAFATPAKGSTASSLVVYYVIAFLVGYREETFRELVKRVTDLLFTKTQQPLGPGQALLTFEAGGSGVEQLDFGPVAVGAQATKTVTISNTGTAALTAPRVTVTTDDAPGGGPFTKANDQVSGQGDLEPGAARTVDVVFSPPAGGAAKFTGEVSVTSTALKLPALVPLSGSRQ